jgi:hypothetical protein
VVGLKRNPLLIVKIQKKKKEGKRKCEICSKVRVALSLNIQSEKCDVVFLFFLFFFIFEHSFLRV